MPFRTRVYCTPRCTRWLDHLRQYAPYDISRVTHVSPVRVKALSMSGFSFSIRARVISAYRHLHARNMIPDSCVSTTVFALILPRTNNATLSSGGVSPIRVSISRMTSQNFSLITPHVAICKMFSISLHAVHWLESADVSFPTVYSVRCQTLVHWSLSRAVTKKTIFS